MMASPCDMLFDEPPRRRAIRVSDLEPNHEVERRLREHNERMEREALSDNETEFDQDDLDARLDACPSPLHRYKTFWTAEYEARRRAKRPLMSPPPTPPQGYLLPTASTKRKRDSGSEVEQPQKRQKSEPTPAEVRKAKRIAPRRPSTRSMIAEQVALHPHKRGKVMRWFSGGQYAVMSYEQYRTDYDLEGPRYAPREIKRRWPEVSQAVLDQYGGLDPGDDPYPPQGHNEKPYPRPRIQEEADKSHKFYVGDWPWRQHALAWPVREHRIEK